LGTRNAQDHLCPIMPIPYRGKSGWLALGFDFVASDAIGKDMLGIWEEYEGEIKDLKA